MMCEQQQQQEREEEVEEDLNPLQCPEIVPPPSSSIEEEEEEKEEVGSRIGLYTWKDRGAERCHNFLLPKKSIRAIIVGKSGFGKSTLLNYLLIHPEMLDYDTLTVCGKSLHQPE